MRSSTLLPALLPLTVSLTLLGACDDGSGLVVVDDPGTLTITVDASTGATTPTYRWDGGAARELSVMRADGTAVAWRLEAVDLDVGFVSPVQQDVVPAGARETTVGDLLESGVAYRIRVEDVEGAHGTVVYRP